MLVRKCYCTGNNTQLLCFKYKAQLQTFSDHSSLPVITDSWQNVYRNTRNFCSFNMMTKLYSDFSFKPGVLKIPNFPTWSLLTPTFDLYVLDFICRTGSHTPAPPIRSYIHKNYSQFIAIDTDGSKTTRGWMRNFN